MGDATVNSAQRAHALIRAGILSGEFPAGDMLSESTLAASMSMSRTPVRAALGRLQDEGLVRIYPKRGALVRELTVDEIRQSDQVRHAFECAGVQLGSLDARQLLSARLQENLDGQEQALHRRDYPGFAALAMQFHRAFVELADNATMLAFYDRLQDRQHLSIVRNSTVRGQPDLVLAEHRSLLKDAEAGDWTAFSTRLREHQSHGNDFE
ncbi:GntR family transcriptional regulator [Mycolicibacter heraklionensis]|uniref:GntR family transcriptional regulator n=1 Tax=Mycolicibacter heraklionensis TaxID=512402 RepID=UPI0007EF6138|nr:GntR family transcriptional regulator [Mycolicibacter heraklionensis]OBJ28982.1 GntR family transcriptional regulator [Mycolicibacter heraklionensis]